MGSTEIERVIRARQRTFARMIADEYRRARLDAGASLRAVGRAATLSPSHIQRIEQGDRLPSLGSLVAIATALGQDVSLRLYPSTGPRIRDHVQATMIEALLEVLHERWLARLEVPVYRPARGVIDAVLQDRESWQLVSGEAHGQLRAVEQQLRRAGEKTDSLPSASGWPWADLVVPPPVSRLLLLRSTSATRALVRGLSETFRAAYPAATRDAYEALTVSRPWPGAAIVWVDVAGARTRILHGPPRGV